ncbi:hypothetical protein DFR29_103158 [Tahibacter aquaticus]|uniref:Outer membrane protein assembly factor BamB n=1 Tax=Tahibacter aquaticus TaxID=520092 RepID=A0A4R6Z4S3_9GAMM|nr:hypothetical protein [Tahibacter aquaticus]TDR46624.1 hypothetical protein DFR29_103158 [Tahibacter aquaticus]
MTLLRSLPLLLCALAADAADWRTLQPQLSRPVTPDSFRIGADGSIWSFSTDGVRRSDAGGTTVTVHRSAFGDLVYNDLASDAVLLADGGALLDVSGVRGGSAYCTVQRIDALGRPTWRAEIPLQYETCKGLHANAAGQAWLPGGEKLYRLSPTGAVAAEVAQVGSLGYAERPLAVTSDGAAIAATQLRGVDGTRLTRFNAAAGEDWRWTGEVGRPLDLVTLSSDGGVFALERNFARDYLLRRWNGSGQLSWARSLPGSDDKVRALIAADAGGLYQLSSVGYATTLTLQRIAADGSLRWQKTLACPLMNPIGRQVVRLADDGLALLCQDGDGTQLQRLDRNGTAAASLPLPQYQPRQLAQQRDGRLLLLLRERLADLSGTATRWLVVSSDNQAVPSTLDGRRDAAASWLAGQAALADGSVYLLGEPFDGSTAVPTVLLSRIGGDGRTAWTRQLDGKARSLGAALAAAPDRVCIARASPAAPQEVDDLSCFNAAEGALRWSQFPGSTFPPRFMTHLQLDSGGGVVLVRSNAASHEVQHWSGSGSLRYGVSGSRKATRAIVAGSGPVSVITTTELIRYNPDGSVGFRIGQNDAPLQFADDGSVQGVASAADGSLWLAGRSKASSGQRLGVWALAPDGSTRWAREVDGIAAIQLLHAGDALYLLQSGLAQLGGDPGTVLSRLSRLSAVDGSTAWTYESLDPWIYASNARYGRLALLADASKILLVHSWNHRLRLQRLDTASGAREHEAFVACGGYCAQAGAVALDAAGRAHIVAEVLDRQAGQSAAAFGVDHAGLAAPPHPLDQAGIAGAWWSPYAHSEGIVLDWLAGSRTLFGAWFTYSSTGGNDPAELRWYTLQANGVAAAATALELPILQTAGGNFAAGPAVTPARVGTAMLAFTDCDNATLRYRFDAGHNDGRSGILTLSRLSPATRPCLRADGSRQPGAGARPPLQGFDARLSGSWYDAATPGQGLQLTVQPGGVFFAAWFTYDLQGSGNDAARQHWFTLQGDLATAGNGSAAVQLVQTTGGSFDRVPSYDAYVVGSATLRMQACDRAQLDYRFGNDPRAAAFAGRSGTLQLSRIGGCDAP